MNSEFTQDFFSGKRLLILGAGYVGSAVGNSFLERGGEVTALTRNEARAARFSAQGMQTIQADISGDEWHEKTGPNPDFVLDCVSSGGGGVEGYRRSYLAGAQSILRWSQATHQTGHLVYTGSTSVYAQGDGQLVDESMAATSPEERAAILRQTETTIGKWPGRWSILRLAGIYGPQRHSLLDGLRAGHATVSGTGETWLNLVHRDDIVTAILQAFTAGEAATNRVFNVVDDGRSTKAEVVAWLADRLGRAKPEFTGQTAPGRRAFMPSRIISNARIKTELNWSPRYPTFREGYDKILEA